jgi:hypothetical protein
VKETLFVERARTERKGVERRDWFDTDAASFNDHWYETLNCVATTQKKYRTLVNFIRNSIQYIAVNIVRLALL